LITNSTDLIVESSEFTVESTKDVLHVLKNVRLSFIITIVIARLGFVIYVIMDEV